MTQELSLQQICENKASTARVGLWADVSYDWTNASVLLGYSGNDPAGIVPVGMARPVHGGVYLGEVDKSAGVAEKAILQLEDKPVLGSTVLKGVRYVKETGTVKARLLFTNDTNVKRLLNPSASYSNHGYIIGGKTAVPLHSLLVIIQPDYPLVPGTIECHFYHSGYFDAAEFINGRLVSPLDMLFTAVAGVNPLTGCLLAAGMRVGNGWKAIINADGTNSFVNIDTEMPLIPITVPLLNLPVVPILF